MSYFIRKILLRSLCNTLGDFTTTIFTSLRLLPHNFPDIKWGVPFYPGYTPIYERQRPLVHFSFLLCDKK